MRIPAILQGEARTRFLQGIAFGAVAAMAIGFIWGGWVTGGTELPPRVWTIHSPARAQPALKLN